MSNPGIMPGFLLHALLQKHTGNHVTNYLNPLILRR
jgi:hypothetical protein